MLAAARLRPAKPRYALQPESTRLAAGPEVVHLFAWPHRPLDAILHADLAR